MTRAFATVSITKADAESRVVEGIASTVSTDRMGDRLNSKGMVARLPVPFLWGHAYDAPVGQVVWVKSDDSQVRFRAELAKVDHPPSLVERLETAFASLKSGLIRGVSVGFKPLDREPLPGGGWHYKSWELLEISAVSVPANQDCSITAIKRFDRQTRTRIVRLTEADRLAAKAALSSRPVSDALANYALRADPNDLPELVGQSIVELSRATDAALQRMDFRLRRLEGRSDAP